MKSGVEQRDCVLNLEKQIDSGKLNLTKNIIAIERGFRCETLLRIVKPCSI